MTTITLTSDEYAGLLAERQSLLADQHKLTQQLRLVTVERDLLKERVDAFLRQLFAAKSEARAHPAQRDMFINEAEALAPRRTADCRRSDTRYGDRRCHPQPQETRTQTSRSLPAARDCSPRITGVRTHLCAGRQYIGRNRCRNQ
jgi:transposase